jgi:hypothetical protein
MAPDIYREASALGRPRDVYDDALADLVQDAY